MKDNQLGKMEILVQAVQNENLRQVGKWGIQDRSSFEWLTYLMEEVGELAEAISEYEYRGASMDSIFKEAIQVSTLALKIAEMSRLIPFVKDEEIIMLDRERMMK
jgi:NTP pyrophosphatase (non-canonical NTP hydrolase)